MTLNNKYLCFIGVTAYLIGIVVIASVSCDVRDGRRLGCDARAVRTALDCAQAVTPSIAEVADRMTVYCVDDTTRMCLRDVDACTVGVGSVLVPGRMVSHNRVPVENSIAHEQAHWKQMLSESYSSSCPVHSDECGWEPLLVEDVLDCIDLNKVNANSHTGE